MPLPRFIREQTKNTLGGVCLKTKRQAPVFILSENTDAELAMKKTSPLSPPF
jgi:hypothetical protein